MEDTKKKAASAVYFFKKQKKTWIILALIFLLCLVGELFIGRFLNLNQALTTVKFASYTALFGLCQLIVIACGGNGIDLSVGYIATLSGIFGVAVMKGENKGLPLAILIAVLVGLLFGVINGILVSYFRLSALVVTMAMSSVIQGIVNAYAAGMSISGNPSPVLRTIATKSTFGIPNIVFLLVLIILLVFFILKKTKIGAILFGVGENETTAFLSGVNVRLVRCMAFAVSGVVGGLIGLLLVGNMGMAYKDMASSYLLPSYAAVVVGGISLSGGEGHYLRVALGAVFLQVLTNLFIQFGGGDAVRWTGYGVVLYVLLLFYANDRRKR